MSAPVLDEQFLTAIADDPAFPGLASDLKIAIYRRFGATIGDGVVLRPGVRLLARAITIGDGVTIGEGGQIEADSLTIETGTTIGRGLRAVAAEIHLGKRNRLADDITIDVAGGKSRVSKLITGPDCLLCNEVLVNACRTVRLGGRACLSPKAMIFTHSYWQPATHGAPAMFGPVTVGDGAWVGAGAQVLPGIEIGAGATVMSNSLVVGSVDAGAMVGGIPAVVTKEPRKVAFRPRAAVLLAQFAEHLTLRLDYLGFSVVGKDTAAGTLLQVDRDGQPCAGVALVANAAAVEVERHGSRTIVVGLDLAEGVRRDADWIDLAAETTSGPSDLLMNEARTAARRLGLLFDRD